MDKYIEKANDSDWAWAEFEPDADLPWNIALAGHLYRRAAFGANWEQLQQALLDGPRQTIDKLLRPQANMVAFNHTFDEYESSVSSVDTLQAWWLRRMIQTPQPLLEKMTLFWHSYFATNAMEVKNVPLIRQHIRLLRSQALGSFRILLEDISKDPAVLLWLGTEANRKARPNENLARAIMENFTLGPGHCSEDDISNASRAFTGWFVLKGKLRFIPREYDGSEKQILGQRGNFTRDDVLRIVLDQPATPHRIVCELYKWLISEIEKPDEALIVPLAESFAKDYDAMKIVETMLRSNLFFSSAAYRRRIKSPVEFAVGIIIALEGSVSTTQLANDLDDLGQSLYNPPTIKGWAGGKHWINNTAIIARHNLALALLSGSNQYGNKLNPWAVAQKHGCTKLECARKLLYDLFLQEDPDSGVYDSLPMSELGKDNKIEEQMRSFAYTVVTLPEFHLA